MIPSIKRFSTGFFTFCAFILGIQDFLEPIYSLGGYLVFFFSILFIYVLFLAKKYRSAEELIENKKALSHIPQLREFYRAGWRLPAVAVFFFAFVISAAGAYTTHQSSDAGGFLASKYPSIADLQQSFGVIIKGQAEIKEAVDSVKNDTNKIRSDTDTLIKKATGYPISEIIREAKASEDPYGVFRYYFNKEDINMDGDIDNLIYASFIIGARDDDTLVHIFMHHAFSICKPGSFKENQALQVIKNVRPSTDATIFFDVYFDGFAYCVGENNLTAKTLSEIYFPDGQMSYFNEDWLRKHMRVIRRCKESIPESIARSVSMNDKWSAEKFVDYFEENPSPCISKDFLSILKTKITDS